jgi:hypothetical protein
MADDLLDTILNQRLLNKSSSLGNTFFQQEPYPGGTQPSMQNLTNMLKGEMIGAPKLATETNLNMTPDQAKPPTMPMSFEDMANLEKGIEERGFAPDSMLEIMRINGISNAGAPTAVRNKRGLFNLTDPKLKKLQIEKYLKEHFTEQGLITDKYNLGLRIGPVTERLEFKDPRNGGMYTVFDPVGTDLTDITELSGGAITVGGEVVGGVAGVPTMPVTGPIGPAVTSSAGALAATLAKLYTAYALGDLPPETTHQDILNQAYKDAAWGAAGALGGQLAYKIARGVLKNTGLMDKGLPFDFDEEIFIESYNKFQQSQAGQDAIAAGVSPTSAQVLQGASKAFVDEGNLFKAARAESEARELLRLETEVSKLPDFLDAGQIMIPKIQQALQLEKTAKTALLPENFTIENVRNFSGELSEKLGLKVQASLQDKLTAHTTVLNQSTNRALDAIDETIERGLNLSKDPMSKIDLGVLIKDELFKIKGNTQKNLKDLYEQYFKEWSQQTNIKLNDVNVGKPTILVNKAMTLRKQMENAPWVNKEDMALLDSLIGKWALGGKGAAQKIKNISLQELNDALLNLRALERKVFAKNVTGQDAASTRLISELTKTLEETRDAFLRKKDVRITNSDGSSTHIADLIKANDDAYLDFTKMWTDKNVSTIAKALDNKLPPKRVLDLVLTPDKGPADAKAVYNAILSSNQKDVILTGIRDAVLKEWRKKVVKYDDITGTPKSVNVAEHKKFQEKYGGLLQTYFPDGTPLNTGLDIKSIAVQVNDIMQSQKKRLRILNDTFNIKAGSVDEVFEKVWKPQAQDRVSEFKKVAPIIKNDSELERLFKGFALKDMVGTTDDLIEFNGRKLHNPEKILTYINEKDSQLRILFGDQYVDNLQRTHSAIKNIMDMPKPRTANLKQDVLTGIIRAWLGVFTRPGRALTALNIIRKRHGNNILPDLLLHPGNLKTAALASKTSYNDKVAAQIVGRMFQDYIGESDVDMPVEKGNDAKRLLGDIEFLSNMQELGPETMTQGLTEKALLMYEPQ